MAFELGKSDSRRAKKTYICSFTHFRCSVWQKKNNIFSLTCVTKVMSFSLEIRLSSSSNTVHFITPLSVYLFWSLVTEHLSVSSPVNFSSVVAEEGTSE